MLRSAVLVLASVAVVTLTLPPPCAADSDGRFCVGPGYVAIEARGIYLSAGVPTVRITRVGSSTGIPEPLTVEVEPFQADGMRCAKDRIEFSGGHVIDLSDPEQPRYVGRREDVVDPPYSGDDNVAYVRGARVLEIPTAGSDHHFSLVIGHAEENLLSDGGGMLLHHFVARVVESSADGEFLRGRIVAEGIRLESVD